MNKKFLNFNTYSDALDALTGMLDSRKVDLSKRHIVITPEKYTLLCERRLFKNNNGAFDVEVLSLGRLYFKLGGGFCLPKEGAVMIIKQILSDAELKCFNRSKKHRGFCERLYTTICGFILSAVPADALDGQKQKTAPALKMKLQDIKYVYQEFLNRIQGMRVDRHGKLEAVKDALKNNPQMFLNARVYIANFDYITNSEQQIFDLISEYCLSFTQFNVSGRPPAIGQAEIYCAPDAAKAVKAAAKRILDAAKNGVKFSDMCLVCAPQSLLPAQRIFNEYGIPLYTEQKEKLSDQPLSRYLLSLLRLKRPSRDEYAALSKNPCAGIAFDESDIFENYCARFLIDYLAFNQPFTRTDPDKPDEKERATAEKVRRKLSNIVLEFYKELEKVKSVSEFCAVINKTIEARSGGRHPCHSELVNNPPHGTAKAKLSEILSLMEKTLDLAGNNASALSAARLSFLIEAFTEGIESARLSFLPMSSECVIASDASAFRGGRFKYALILDFNEGVIPPAAQSAGVLNNVDAAALKAAGVEIGLSADQVNELCRDEILRLAAASERLFIAYLKTDDLRPSPLIYSLSEDKHYFNSYDAEQIQLQEKDKEFLSFYAACPSAGLEYLLLSAPEPTVLTSALYEILYKTADAYLSDSHEKHPPVDNTLFFNHKKISASRLQLYFECPYKHFVRYGLKVKDKPDGAATALDAGAVIHRMAEKFVKSGLNEDGLDRILDETPFGYKYDLPQNSGYKEKLKKEIKKLCLIFAANVKSGAFTPLGAEIKINELTNPVVIGGLTLNGSIDYADACGGYARIIDYKSGGEKFEEKTLYHGVKLQLPLYMRALLQNGYRPAALHFFKFKSKWEDGGYGFTGIFNSDPDVVKDMDFAIAKIGESAFLTAELKTNKDGIERVTGAGGKTEKEITEYCDYAVDVSTLAVSQIENGNIDPSPYYRDARHNACVYCTYKPACGYSGEFRRASKSVFDC